MPDHDQLRRAAERAAARPFFLASALLAYARDEGLDDEALSQRLGCDPSDLPALLLCRRPSGSGLGFRDDVLRISARFGVDAGRLAEMVRYGDAVEGLRRDTGEARVDLLAARDRDDAEAEP